MIDRRTIFALSSGQGRAGVAVVRISGPASGLVMDRMAAPRPKPRYAAFRRIRHPETGELLDEALALWFPGPRSETGEDMAELQVHGSSAVLRAVFAALGSLPGCRMAEPGEFARRAFEAGRIDLTGAEGLADLIDAETDAQRRQALVQAGGALARLYDGWRERLVEARALVEAAIDFSDEADVAADVLAKGRAAAAVLDREIAAHLDDASRGEIVRDGFRIVLAGPPNAGKSSILNALARRDVAIVSPEAGTTRDVLEVRLDLGGYAAVLTDTAGIREASGAVEAEGIRRAMARSREADLVLWIVDAGHPQWEIPAGLGGGKVNILTVLNKMDLAGHSASIAGRNPAAQISALTGYGLDLLVRILADRVKARLEVSASSSAVITRERHRAGLEAAHIALGRLSASPTLPAELQAEELRLAADSLGRIIGRIDVEDILSQIFGRFCIGK